MKAAPAKSGERRATPLFVYGSLLHPRHRRNALGARVAATLPMTPARLRGWRRWWNGSHGSFRGAVLNLKRDRSASLWGLLLDGLSEASLSRLDAQERSHLPRERVLVVTAEGRRVWASCYRQRVRAPERRPGPVYLAAVRSGARALGPVVSGDVEADVARLFGRFPGGKVGGVRARRRRRPDRSRKG